MRNWFHNERPLASEKEESYIKQREDIVSLRHGRQWTRFHGFIEQTIEILNCRPIRVSLTISSSKLAPCWFTLFQNIFRTTELQDRTDDKLIYYYSARRIEILVNIITTGLMLALLVLPPVVLYRTKVGAEEQSTVSVPAIFVGFTCLFAVVMVLILGVNRHELFAAMAVYCAVLAAFVGSTGSGQNCGNCSWRQSAGRCCCDGALFQSADFAFKCDLALRWKATNIQPIDGLEGYSYGHLVISNDT